MLFFPESFHTPPLRLDSADLGPLLCGHHGDDDGRKNEDKDTTTTTSADSFISARLWEMLKQDLLAAVGISGTPHAYQNAPAFFTRQGFEIKTFDDWVRAGREVFMFEGGRFIHPPAYIGFQQEVFVPPPVVSDMFRGIMENGEPQPSVVGQDGRHLEQAVDSRLVAAFGAPTVRLTTLSVRPVVFRVEGIASPHACREKIRLAEAEGSFQRRESNTRGGSRGIVSA